jgi:hypothetical protein
MTKWTKGKTGIATVKAIEIHADIIRDGVLLAIDPASKSMGWALFYTGTFVEKGTIVSKKKNVNDRLQDIGAQLQEKLKTFKCIDILAIEKIRGSRAHDYLKWAIGMSIVTVHAPRFVEVPVQFWRKIIPADYIKSDENDAEMIGTVVTMIAEEHHG